MGDGRAFASLAPFSNSCCYFLWTLCSAQPLPRTMANMLVPGASLSPPSGIRGQAWYRET